MHWGWSGMRDLKVKEYFPQHSTNNIRMRFSDTDNLHTYVLTGHFYKYCSIILVNIVGIQTEKALKEILRNVR